MEWWYGVLMEDFSYDLIESSQYMQHARDLDPNLALFVGSFFFPHDRMASKFSGICLRERERESARARVLFSRGRERDTERKQEAAAVEPFATANGSRGPLWASISFSRKRVVKINLGGLCEKAQRRSLHLILLGETC